MSASDEPEKTPAELEEDAGALEALRWWRETERLRDEGEANNLLAKIRRLTDKSGGSKGCHIWLGQFCRTKPYVSYARTFLLAACSLRRSTALSFLVSACT